MSININSSSDGDAIDELADSKAQLLKIASLLKSINEKLEILTIYMSVVVDDD